MRRYPIRLAVLTPVYEDWDCLLQFIKELSVLQATATAIELLIVNDGSTSPCPPEIATVPAWLESITVLDLVSNVGHQRAIAIGLGHLVQTTTADAILTLDGDGEDAPQDALNLLHFWLRHPTEIAVASRAGRTEGLAFSWFYRAYKICFRMFTGVRIDFGNFAILSLACAKRLAAMPELWNHYPAAILRSKLPLKRLPIRRGRRFAGRSRMGLVPLINHGLSAVSVFFDIVLARLLALTVILALFLVLLALCVLAIKLFTSLAIPGWASLVFGLTAVAILQVLTTQVVVVFLALSTRSRFERPTLAVSAAYIDNVSLYQRS